MYQGKKYICNGCQHYGQYVAVKDEKALPAKSVMVVRYAGGWKPVLN